MEMKILGKFLLFAFFALALGYCGYSAYSYTGLYRLGAELQIHYFNAYDEKITFFATLLCSFAIVGVPLLALEKFLGLNTEATQQELNKSDDEQREVDRKRRTAAFLAVVGVVALLAAGVAGWLAYAEAEAPVVVADIDLAKAADRTPTTGHARLAGIVLPDQTLTLETETGSQITGNHTATESFIPVVPPGWRQGQPVTYFMQLRGVKFLKPAGSDGFVPLTPTTPPFAVKTEEGVLLADGLPGAIAELYRRNGMVLAATTAVFDRDTRAEETHYSGVAIFAGMFALTCLFTAGLFAIVLRRRRSVGRGASGRA
jgi:hypothetical protein